MKYFLFCILLTGCGITVKHKVSGDVTGKVEIAHTIQLGQLLEYMEAYCKATLPPEATEAEIAICTNKELVNFLKTLGNVTAGS